MLPRTTEVSQSPPLRDADSIHEHIRHNAGVPVSAAVTRLGPSPDVTITEPPSATPDHENCGGSVPAGNGRLPRVRPVATDDNRRLLCHGGHHSHAHSPPEQCKERL